MAAARTRTDAADTVVVLAKQPLPGRVKTRLQARFTPDQAAGLAAASIRDTLTAVRAYGTGRAGRAVRRVLVWDGDLTGFDAGFEVVPQRAGSLNDRLAGAFADTAAPATRPGGRTLLIGMDTPQVTAALLDRDWGGCDAVLGLSEDGGFWAIGLRTSAADDVFAGVEMSTARTGAAQLARLVALGRSVALLPPLRDVDEPSDAEAVAAAHPWLEFSRRHGQLMDGREGVEQLFDRAYAGTAVCSDARLLSLDLARWRARADDVDGLVVSRCRPPVLDVGCGPGRMVQALNEAGLAALGLDMSTEAVRATRARGALAVRARLADRVPAEGRWGTVLLMDGNVGIGGDVVAILERCRQLLAIGGAIIVELDARRDRHDQGRVRLTDESSGRFADLDWVRVGSDTVRTVAARLDLLVTEEWSADGRAFMALQVTR